MSLVPDVPPPVPACRRALSRGSPVLRALLSGPFAERRQRRVRLRRCPRRPLLLLLHFLHGCRPGRCPHMSPGLDPAAAGAALALSRRFLVPSFERAAAAAVSGSPAQLWALAELWGCPPLARRVAGDILGAGGALRVAPALAAVAEVAKEAPALVRALLGEIGPAHGAGLGHAPGELSVGGGAEWDPLVGVGGWEGDVMEGDEGDDVMDEGGDVMEGDDDVMEGDDDVMEEAGGDIMEEGEGSR